MKKLEIQGKTGHSAILVGESISRLKEYVSDGKCMVITDQNVKTLYGEAFRSFPVIEVGMGEKSKTIETVMHIFEELVSHEMDRSGFIVGIGGGIVCDITGFVASTYMRGVRFGFVSTTLLSQVDASVGGKNGVNFFGYKNMVGTFNQPEFVICDMALLKTLPLREVRCGFGEIVKHALIGDPDLCDFLEKNHKKALALDPEVIARLVYDSVVIKSGVVNRDETEKGERKKLNFGHTFGHAIEKSTGLLHGEAISIGMVVAAKLSQKKGLLSTEEVERITSLLLKLDLPVKADTDKTMLLDAMKKDKKRKGDEIDFVLLNGIGNAIIEGISYEALEEVVSDL